MRQILIVLVLAILTGCAVKQKPDINSIPANEVLPPNWTINGRVALKTPQDKFSAALQWQQDTKSYQLRLSKLIGGTLLLLENKDSVVTLQFDGKTYQDSHAERLLWQVTGWTFPIADFEYWVSGRLNPGSQPAVDIKRDDTGRIWSFTSADNWQVRYQNYKVFAGKALPHNLIIKKDDLQLKLRVSGWQFDGD